MDYIVIVLDEENHPKLFSRFESIEDAQTHVKSILDKGVSSSKIEMYKKIMLEINEVPFKGLKAGESN